MPHHATCDTARRQGVTGNGYGADGGRHAAVVRKLSRIKKILYVIQGGLRRGGLTPALAPYIPEMTKDVV